MCESCKDDTLWSADPHTLAKHGLLRRYLQAWLPTLTSWSRRVLFVDGFAGPGRYLGGEPGSPLVALNALLSHSRRNAILRSGNEVVFHFIEEREDRLRHLESELEDIPHPDNLRTVVQRGTFEDIFGRVLDRLDQARRRPPPCLVFPDPFGPTGIPMRLIGRLAQHPATEVLVNFAYQPLNQWFISDTTKHPRVDELFGGRAWRRVFDLPTDEREQYMVDTYVDSLRQHGFAGIAFRMVNHQNQTQYYLVFGTQHHLGMRYFKEAAWAVSQNGEFSYSDLRHEGQLSFGAAVTDNLVVEDLVRKIFEQSRGNRVAADAIFEAGDWHPAALPKHTRQALAQLENESPPRIVRVTRPDGKRRRPGSFPDDCEITFADAEQDRMF